MSLEDIPLAFADFAGITEASAQVILSTIVIFAILLPALYLSKANKVIAIVMLFFGETLCIGLGWLPFWMLIATIAVMGIAIAMLGTDTIVGD